MSVSLAPPATLSLPPLVSTSQLNDEASPPDPPPADAGRPASLLFPGVELPHFELSDVPRPIILSENRSPSRDAPPAAEPPSGGAPSPVPAGDGLPPGSAVAVPTPPVPLKAGWLINDDDADDGDLGAAAHGEAAGEADSPDDSGACPDEDKLAASPSASGAGKPRPQRASLGRYGALVAGKIEAACEKLAIEPKVRERAHEYFGLLATTLHVIREKWVSPMAAACLYSACRDFRCSCTPKELYIECGAARSDFARWQLRLARHLEATRPEPTGGRSLYKTEYIERFCREFALPGAAVAAAHEMFAKMRAAGLCASRASLSLSAATLYYLLHVFGMPTGLCVVAKRVGVGDTTLKDTYREMYARRVDIFPASAGLPVASLKLLPPY